MQIALEGKTAVVTGASSGIGAATARELASAGARVIAVGRDRDRLRAVAEGNDRIEPCAGDLNEDTTFDVISDAVAGRGRGCDVIVHAGGHFESSTLADTQPDMLDRLWRVHVRAPLLLTQRLLPQMRDGGHVVFFSSTAARQGFAPYSAYTGMKGAVEAITRSLAIELAPKLRVNCIVPGFTRTPMMQDQWDAAEGLEEAVRLKTPVGFIGGPEYCAQLIAFLSSDAGAFTTGQLHIVDGGWTTQGWQAQ
jgi:NAD(P)-dependent dehydrogenase (short-subunit alcohol dehydrogenase family)